MRLITILLIGFLLGSCRSPERLIEIALDRDPGLAVGGNDTIELVRFQIDSIPVVKHDTVIWEKVIREIKYDTIIPTSLIDIERKKTRLEIRKSFRLDKERLKLERLLIKKEAEIDKLGLRLKDKEDKRDTRQENKESRREERKSRWKFWLILGMIIGLLLPRGFRMAKKFIFGIP